MQNLTTTRRLQIRSLREDDLEDFFAYRSDPEVTRYQGFHPFNKAESLAFIREQSASESIPGKWKQWAISADNQLVGDCALLFQASDPRIAEIGITISPRHQRKGFAREAMEGLTAYLFEKENIHRIAITVDAENMASIALMKSLGFRQEGYFIENVFFKGKWGSEILFALLRREWEKMMDNG